MGIKPSLLSNKTLIQASPLQHRGVLFSFKYLDRHHAKFSIGQCKINYFEKLLDRLKDVCGFSAQELRGNRSSSLRAHPIVWSDTTEKSGFSHLNPQLRDIQGWQFEITANDHGRVHGLFIDDIFYLIWFDPCHRLYA